MHILNYLYLLDFFAENKIEEGLSKMTVHETEEPDFASKVFMVEVEDGVNLVLDIGIYKNKKDAFYIECNMYVVKNNMWIEEYDLIYLNSHRNEAKTIVNIVREGVRSLREEIKERNLPVKVYNTTRQKYQIAKKLSEKEIKDCEEYIGDFEHNDLPYYKQEFDLVVQEENEKAKELELERSQKAEKVLINSLKIYYKKEVDKALAENNKGAFMHYSRLYTTYSEKLKKLHL